MPSSVNLVPAMVKETGGSWPMSEQSTTYWPNAMGVAPSALFSASTSALGPAIRDVPVSAMAWQPCHTNKQSIFVQCFQVLSKRHKQKI